MKQLIFPAMCALGIHAALFHFHFESTRPAFSVTENRTVTISLVQTAPQPRPEPVAPLAPPRAGSIRPLKALPAKPPPRKTLDPAPQPLPPPTPEPAAQAPPEPESPADPAHTASRGPTGRPAVEQPPDAAAAGPETAAAEESARDSHPLGPDQARVQASVPLYALNPAPAYPAVARRRNYQGTVILDVLVDRRGRAVQVKVAESSGHGILDRSALQSVRRWRFEPARRFGRPIEMWVQVPVRFALE